MSQNHGVTKPHRRQKGAKRKDFTRETMVQLRSTEKTSLASQREKELSRSQSAGS